MQKIINSILFTAFAAIAANFAAQTTVEAAQLKPAMQNLIPKPNKSGHASVNGLDYYYAIYGAGEPLLLLHGGMFHTEMFGLTLTKLAQSRKVIGIDLQGHGRTALGDRAISLIDMGNDMAGVLRKLGYDKVDVLGYSMGGGVAFQLAVQHPEIVRRLVLVSTPFSQDGFYPEMLPQQAALGAAMAEQMKETPIYQSYAAIAPHPEEFPKLLDQMGAYMRKPYDWSADVMPGIWRNPDVQELSSPRRVGPPVLLGLFVVMFASEKFSPLRRRVQHWLRRLRIGPLGP